MTTRSQRWRSSFLGVALVVALASWGLALAQPPAAEEPVIRVVVSLHPWADVIRQIGGERVAVTSLLPAGASSHAFEPLPSQAAELSRADLVVMNGGLDSWLDRLLQAVAPDAQHLRLMDIVDFAPLQGVEDHHDDGDGVTPQQETHPRALSAANPHIWLDPTIVMRAVPLLRAELALLDPAGEQLFQDNAASLLMDLDALDLVYTGTPWRSAAPEVETR